MSREELRTRLGLEARPFTRLTQRMLATEVIAESGPLVRLASHEVRYSDEEQRQVDLLIELLRRYGASPPDRADLERQLGLAPELVQALIDQGRLVEASSELVYDRETYDQLVARIVAAIQQSGPITIASVRDLLDASRKYALALMGHLDERKITRRVGDERVLN
jgi:selenocysteine-specific elongation factor